MLKTGKDSSLPENEVTPQGEVRVPLRILLIGVATLLIGIYIGSQVLGVLYAIFFPPVVPVPDEAIEVLHTSEAFGVDDWLYNTSMPACEVVQFYVENGAECRIVPGWCGTTAESGVISPGASTTNQNVARCATDVKFSIFALRWQVVVATGSSAPAESQFRINREIFWTGSAPPVSQFQP